MQPFLWKIGQENRQGTSLYEQSVFWPYICTVNMSLIGIQYPLLENMAFPIAYQPQIFQTQPNLTADQGLNQNWSEQREIQQRSPLEIKIEGNEEKQNEKEIKSYKFQQKSGRNINSNIFSTFLKELKGNGTLRSYIPLIIDRHSLKITQVKFYQILAKCKPSYKNYINCDQILFMVRGSKYCKRMSKQNKALRRQFEKILRILAKIYLSSLHILNIYTKGQIRQDSRLLHPPATRKLLQLIISKHK